MSRSARAILVTMKRQNWRKHLCIVHRHQCLNIGPEGPNSRCDSSIEQTVYVYRGNICSSAMFIARFRKLDRFIMLSISLFDIGLIYASLSPEYKSCYYSQDKQDYSDYYIYPNIRCSFHRLVLLACFEIKEIRSKQGLY